MEKLYKQVGDEVIEFTEADYAQAKLDAEELERLAQITATKLAAKAAAETKLEALGLTTDDLKALGLGGN